MQYAFRTKHFKGMPFAWDTVEPIIDMDPCHRACKVLFKQWQEICIQNTHTPSFWWWLEEQPREITEAMQTDSRFKHAPNTSTVEFKEGHCYNAYCSNTDDSKIADGVYVYNINSRGELGILPTRSSMGKSARYGPYTSNTSGIEVDVTYNHNTVAQEESVICAGCVCFQNGKITLIDTNSGHFKPTFRKLCHAIQSSLIPHEVFATDAKISDHEHSEMISIQDLLSKDLDSQKSHNKRR